MTGRPEVARNETRSPLVRAVLVVGVLLVVAILIALGSWQVRRLHWKLDLIRRVDQRIHAPPIAVPAAADWSKITAAADEYRRVRVRGTFLNDRETLVQALSVLGAGDWVITPLRRANGSIVLINRGFVPPDRRAPESRAAGQISSETSVTGLLRLSEPRGGFLRTNDPANGRWYSRDVGEIAAARHLSDVAPFFIDADATPNPGGYPVGGLTVVAFPNNHLVYAITWFGLAAMLLGAVIWPFAAPACLGWIARRRSRGSA